MSTGSEHSPMCIPVEKSDMSAREAAHLMKPHCESLGLNWRPAVFTVVGGANSAGRLLAGRLLAGVGAWQVIMRRSEGKDFVCVRLFGSGRLSISRGDAGVEPPPEFDLFGNWLDSTAVADTFIAVANTFDALHNQPLYMRLRFVENVGLVWAVRRSALDRATNIEIQFTSAIDAYSGLVLVETLRKSEGNRLIEARRRDKRAGGVWLDVANEASPDILN
jgi:hypothetical protein